MIGVIPNRLVEAEIAHAGLTQLHIVDTMHERKALMAELSDAVIALPGGTGTLDELFEMFTWSQLGLHRKPIATLDVGGYWTGFHRFLRDAVQAGFMKPENLSLISNVATVDGLLPALEAYRAPTVGKWLDPEET